MDNFLIVSHGEYAKATLASCEMIAGKLSNVKAIMDSFHRQCGVSNEDHGVKFWFELDSKSR